MHAKSAKIFDWSRTNSLVIIAKESPCRSILSLCALGGLDLDLRVCPGVQAPAPVTLWMMTKNLGCPPGFDIREVFNY